MKDDFKLVKGILCDIDGTLYFKGNPIPDAIETVKKLREKGFKMIFLTNTDSKRPKTVVERLINFGFSINESEVFTPIIAIKEFLMKHPLKTAFFVLSEEVMKEFRDFPQPTSSETPDFVIISDFSDDWRIDRLNQAFRYLLAGSILIGTQGNRYYLDINGLPTLDTGAFVRMLGNAAKVTPKILGKPNPNYFLFALDKLQLKPEEAIVIGDDLESDIAGGLKAGIQSILVKTGKGKTIVKSTSIEPTAVIDSISSLKRLLLTDD